MAEHNDVGALGEGIAAKFLHKKGLLLVERNYWRKWGEIDIVARERSGRVHFIEVKTTSKPYTCNSGIDEWRPEEMIHGNKIKRLKRVIQSYIIEHDVDEWLFDVVIVYLNKRTRIAKCKYIRDIIL